MFEDYRFIVNLPRSNRVELAFTLVELLVVIAIVAIALIIYLPTTNKPDGTRRDACRNNLRQVALAMMLYSGDNRDLCPWEVSTNRGGTKELIETGVVGEHVLKLKPYLVKPQSLLCPAEHTRFPAPDNYAEFNNSNISYFISFDIVISNPTISIQAGDRHLALSGQPVMPGLFCATNPAALGWSKELHFSQSAGANTGTGGNFLFKDGHSEWLPEKLLAPVFERGGLAPRRIAVP